MVNTNPEKIMSRILGTQTTRKARPVRRRILKQDKFNIKDFLYFIKITPKNFRDLIVEIWDFKNFEEFKKIHGTYYGHLFGLSADYVIDNEEKYKKILTKYKNDLLTERQALATGKEVMFIYGDPVLGDEIMLVSIDNFIKSEV